MTEGKKCTGFGCCAGTVQRQELLRDLKVFAQALSQLLLEVLRQAPLERRELLRPPTHQWSRPFRVFQRRTSSRQS